MYSNDTFKGKRVTLIGLGLLGGALNDAKFLLEHGAHLTITDLKSAGELAPSIEQLRPYEKRIDYALGRHKLEDFQNKDFIVQPGNVPTDSKFLLEAEKNNIPVYVSESLFAEYAPEDVYLVGITGTRGKTTVTHAIFEVLEKYPPKGKRVFLAGNVQGKSTLALLDEVKGGDIVVAELDSWACHGMGDIQKSPQLAVFTTFMPDHMNFYKDDLDAYFSDKANIFRYQTADDTLVLGEKVVSLVEKSVGLDKVASRVAVASAEDIPPEWKLKVPGAHNAYNIACAAEALRVLGVSEEHIKEGLENFTGVAGRLELVSDDDGIQIYNDTTATTPDATLAGLRAVTKEKNTVLIMGGTDKNIEADNLLKEIDQYAKAVVLLPGTGTDKVVGKLVGKDFELAKVGSLGEAVTKARELAERGDVILFSPGFASFGMFNNEYHRGEEFNKLVK